MNVWCFFPNKHLIGCCGNKVKLKYSSLPLVVGCSIDLKKKSSPIMLATRTRANLKN